MSKSQIMIELFSDEDKFRSIIAEYVYGIAREDVSQPLRPIANFFIRLVDDIADTKIPLGTSESFAGQEPTAYDKEEIFSFLSGILESCAYAAADAAKPEN